MDRINPEHYKTGKIEVIDFIEDHDLGFHLGNAVKYICRAGKKKASGKNLQDSAIEDLKKAAWYIDREIKRREQQSNEIHRNTSRG